MIVITLPKRCEFASAKHMTGCKMAMVERGVHAELTAQDGLRRYPDLVRWKTTCGRPLAVRLPRRAPLGPALACWFPVDRREFEIGGLTGMIIRQGRTRSGAEDAVLPHGRAGLARLSRQQPSRTPSRDPNAGARGGSSIALRPPFRKPTCSSVPGSPTAGRSRRGAGT